MRTRLFGVALLTTFVPCATAVGQIGWHEDVRRNEQVPRSPSDYDRRLVISTQLPVPWSPPVVSPLLMDELRINPRRPDVRQGDGRFGTRVGRDHAAVDLAAPEGTLVFPIAPGRVSDVGIGSGGAGYRVTIVHDNGYVSRYMHLQPGIPVCRGDRVTIDHVIGKVGRTGNVPEGAQSHVHLQVLDRNGRAVIPNLQPRSTTPIRPSTPTSFNIDVSATTIHGLPPSIGSPTSGASSAIPSPSTLSTATARGFLPTPPTLAPFNRPISSSPPVQNHLGLPPTASSVYQPLNGVSMPLQFERENVREERSAGGIKDEILSGK